MLKCPTSDCPGFITVILLIGLDGEVISKHETKRLKTSSEEKKKSGKLQKSSGSSTSSASAKAQPPNPSKSKDNPKPAAKPKREKQTEVKGAEGGSDAASGTKSEVSPRQSVETDNPVAVMRTDEQTRSLALASRKERRKKHAKTQSDETSLRQDGTSYPSLASMNQAISQGLPPPYSQFKIMKKPLPNQHEFKSRRTTASTNDGHSEKMFHSTLDSDPPWRASSEQLKEVQRRSIYSSFEELIRRNGPIAVDSSEFSQFFEQIPFEFYSLFVADDQEATIDDGRFQLIDGKWYLSDDEKGIPFHFDGNNDYAVVAGILRSGVNERTPTPTPIQNPSMMPTQMRSLMSTQPPVPVEAVPMKSKEKEEWMAQKEMLFTVMSQNREEQQRLSEELVQKNKEIQWLRASMSQMKDGVDRAEAQGKNNRQLKIQMLANEMHVLIKMHQSELQESQQVCSMCNQLYPRFPGMGDKLRQCAARWNEHQFKLQDQMTLIETLFRSRIDAVQNGDASGDETVWAEELPVRPVSPLLLLAEWLRANPTAKEGAASMDTRILNPSHPELDKLDHIVLKIGLQHPDLSRKSIISYVKKLGTSSIKLSELTVDQAVKHVSKLIARSYEQEGTACAICLENLEPIGETIVTLECAHRLHVQCLHPWMAKNRTCPSCRATILLPTEFPKLA